MTELSTYRLSERIESLEFYFLPSAAYDVLGIINGVSKCIDILQKYDAVYLDPQKSDYCVVAAINDDRLSERVIITGRSGSYQDNYNNKIRIENDFLNGFFELNLYIHNEPLQDPAGDSLLVLQKLLKELQKRHSFILENGMDVWTQLDKTKAKCAFDIIKAAVGEIMDISMLLKIIEYRAGCEFSLIAPNLVNPLYLNILGIEEIGNGKWQCLSPDARIAWSENIPPMTSVEINNSRSISLNKYYFEEHEFYSVNEICSNPMDRLRMLNQLPKVEGRIIKDPMMIGAE